MLGFWDPQGPRKPASSASRAVCGTSPRPVQCVPSPVSVWRIAWFLLWLCIAYGLLCHATPLSYQQNGAVEVTSRAWRGSVHRQVFAQHPQTDAGQQNQVWKEQRCQGRVPYTKLSHMLGDGPTRFALTCR